MAPNVYEVLLMVFGVAHLCLTIWAVWWLAQLKVVSPSARFFMLLVVLFLPVFGPVIGLFYAAPLRRLQRPSNVPVD